MMTSEPPLEGLEEMREFVQPHGMEVRRIYFPSVEIRNEDDTVEYTEPFWDTILSKEALATDGKLYAHYMSVSDIQVKAKQAEMWELLVKMVKEGYERVLEENGVGSAG